MSLAVSENNNRNAARQRVLKQAKIYRMNGVQVLDCTIRDLSETGAKLLCKDQMGMPNEMKIFIPADGFMREAKVMWRRGDYVGVNFLSEKLPPPIIRLQNGSSIT